jgi:serine/threonine-protein kinase ATR
MQVALTPAFPPGGLPTGSHAPFATNPVAIHGFGEQIDVMSSLMCPVVIRILGSDGLEYKFLCKPKDDLRKDSRMMDFNTMINRLLAKDADCRRRNLIIRTFSVIPLNENNGLIQWVNDTTVLRDILQVS